MEALARRGLEVVGIDNSPEMTSFAERRLREARLKGRVVLADMSDFGLCERFDGAVCPINTLAHLRPLELDRHFDCMGRHVEAGAHYLVQLALRTADDSADAHHVSTWEMSSERTRLRITWTTEELDFAAGLERQRSRIEILEGERAGDVIEELHVITLWTPDAWTAAVAASPFTRTATYDGEQPRRPLVSEDQPGRLLWHQLTPE